MALRKYVQLRITASVNYEDLMEEWGTSEEEVRAIIEEDAKEILMDAYAYWDVDIRFVEREEND